MIEVNLIALVNIFILCILLLARKNNSLPNKILAVIFLIPGLYFFDSILILSGGIYRIPYFFFLNQYIALLFPILIVKYVNLLLFDEKKRIPFILYLGSFILFIYLSVITYSFSNLTFTEKHNYLTNLSSNTKYPLDALIYTSIFYILQMIYFTYAALRVYRFNKNIDDTVANSDSLQIKYIEKFVAIFWFLNFVLVILYLTLPMNWVDYICLPVVVNVLYFFLLYSGYNHHALYTKSDYSNLKKNNSLIKELVQGISEKDDKLEQKINENQSFNALPSTKEKEINEKIIEEFEKNQLFQNQNLNISLVSNNINEPTYLVSKTINQVYQKNFFDFVNEYRINFALEKLKTMTTIDTIEGIAYDSGFNSRASFYRAFKKYTGKSPTDFLP